MKKIVLTLSLFLAGCANFNTSKSTSMELRGAKKTKGVVALEKKLKSREDQIQDLKDKNLVLAEKARIDDGGINSIHNMNIVSHPQNKKIQVMPVSAKDVKLSERDLYAELLQAYDNNNQMKFAKFYQMFQVKYSKGVLADDAIYLSALLNFANKNYGVALKEFNRVITKYPMSNKRVSSMFGKGIALKKMNLLEPAAKVLAQVQKQFPGSPEALRADVELKVMKR